MSSPLYEQVEGGKFEKIGLSAGQFEAMHARLKRLGELPARNAYRPCPACRDYRRLGNVLQECDACDGLGFVELAGVRSLVDAMR